MTAAELLDQIRQEIERRIKEYDAIIESQTDAQRAERDAWKWAECKSLLSFLDTLQVDEPEGLDEAAVQAHIQIEESGEEITFLNTFKAGAEWMRERMMKDAVDAKIYGYGDGSYELIASWLDLPNGIYKDGDKVHIMIVKEDNR